MLTDVARQQTWPPGPHGIKLLPNDWKLIFLDALKREVRTVPNLDSTGFVNLSGSSSDLSKEEMSEMIELMTAWGAQNGVAFQDDVGLVDDPGRSAHSGSTEIARPDSTAAVMTVAEKLVNRMR